MPKFSQKHVTASFVLLLSTVLLIFSLFIISTNISHFAIANETVGTETELLAAVDSAPTDKSQYIIELTADISLVGRTLSITAGKNIILTSDVDGPWSLIGASGLDTIAIANNGELVIDGVIVTHTSGAMGKGVINSGIFTLVSGEISGNTYSSWGCGVYNYPAGTFVMRGGIISDNKATGFGCVYNGGVFEMFGGVISGNTANRGGGVYNDANFVMRGGIISYNTAEHGGGVYNERGNFTMYDGTIAYNTVIGSVISAGGGVLNIGGNFTMYNGEIANNVADYWGGGVYNEGQTSPPAQSSAGPATFNMFGGVISGNSAGSGGGGVYFLSYGASCNFTMFSDSCVIVGNSAGWGGGVYNERGIFEMFDGLIADNTARNYGGGLYSLYATSTMHDGVISGNNANFGGGVYNNYNDLTILNGEIIDNTAGDSGGGVYNTGVVSVVGDGFVISNNAATGNGGGMYNTGVVSVVGDGFVVSNNVAGNRGGGIVNYGDSFSVVGDGFVVSDNVAGDTGGGVANYLGSFSVVGDDFVVANNAALGSTILSGGGGVYNQYSFSVVGDRFIVTDNNANRGGGIDNSYGGSFSVVGDDFVVANNIIADGDGGGIQNVGKFDVKGDGFVIANNTATDPNSWGGGVYNSAPFSVVGDGFVVSNNVAGDSGGGIASYSGSFSVVGDGFVISDNVALGSSISCGGGGVYCRQGSFNVNGDDFVVANNSAALCYGGGVYVYFISSFSVVGDRFVVANNTAVSGGGAFVFMSDFDVSGDGFEIVNNTADTGGGLYLDDAMFMLPSDGVIANNAAMYGGGVYNSGTFNMSSDGTVVDNTANIGGGVYNSGTFYMYTGAVNSNTAMYGGGVYNSGTFIINGDCTLYGNIADYGGGVYIAGGSVNVQAGEVAYNSATFDGGGIWVNIDNLNRLKVADGVKFSNNHASAAYNRDPIHDAVYDAQIGATVWTSPFTQGYNNYDISYTAGTETTVTLSTDVTHIYLATGDEDFETINLPKGLYDLSQLYKPQSIYDNVVKIVVEKQLASQIIVQHLDINGLSIPGVADEIFYVKSGFYGPYGSIDIPGYEQGIWDFNSDDPSGYIGLNEVITIKYQYAPITDRFVITYDPNGGEGSAIKIVETANQQYPVADQGYIREGHTFLGWNTKPDGTGNQYENGDTLPVTDSIVLYAQWTLQSDYYYVYYFVNDGGGDSYTDVAADGMPYTIKSQTLTGITRTGSYIFLGWSVVDTQNGDTLDYISGDTISVTSELTLYAQWSSIGTSEKSFRNNEIVTIEGDELDVPLYNFEDGYYYTIEITYDSNFYTVKIVDSFDEFSGEGDYLPGISVTIRAGNNIGHDFTGWVVTSGHVHLDDPLAATTSFIMPAEDVTITATWAQNAYNIYYQLDGGTNHPDNPTTYTTNNLPITINNPTKEGYTFFDWIIFYADGHVDRLPTHTIPIGTTGDITLIAHWTTTPYIITYQLDGGINHPSNPSTYTVNDLPIAISNPTKQGYTFTGWTITTTDGITKPLPDEGIIAGTTGDLVLTAYWEFAKDFTVTYDANGGSGDVPVDNNKYSPGDSVVVLPSDLSRLGYDFGGWLYDDTIYDADEVFLMPAMDVVLVAVWEPDEYVVTYAPGAQGTFTAQVYGGLVYGDATPGFVGAVSGNAGYIFVGWSPAVSLVVTGSVTYVAQWEREGSGGGSGGNGGNGGSGGSGGGGGSGSLLVVQFVDWDGTVLKVERVRFGGSATAPVAPSREGFVFIGWDKEFNNVRSNLIVTAQYTPTNSPTPPPTPPENEVPMWALVNLIISVIGLILAIILIIAAILWRKQKQKTTSKQQKQQNTTKNQYTSKQSDEIENETENEKMKQRQRRLLWLLTGVIMGILGIIVFILTEDMTLPMQYVDKWTIVNAIIFIVEIIAITLTFKHQKIDKTKPDEEDNQTQQPNPTNP
ncbi:MAG: InlB B-repeat-containing protein [Candidatus Bathyarchaeota archaeon]|nr:InlB B-repeat-containing protein [Candidatus Termiticorpusculum sp.]